MSSILECIRTVGRGERGRKPLTQDQAYQVMTEYLAGECDDDQMAMLLMLIRVQNETQHEIAGFVQAFQAHMPDIHADIDWPCYAGKRASAGKPWHLLAARLLADKGYRVLMHGYHDMSGNREHAESYLEQLNVPLADSPEHAQKLLDSHNIAYLPLRNFAPQAETMIGWKARYGLRTPINTVVRALNPGQAQFGLRGSFHPGFQELHAEVEHAIGMTKQAVISFKGQSGESEYNPKVSQTVWLSTQDGVSEHYWNEQLMMGIPLPTSCPFSTPKDEWETMSNSVIATLTAVLFTEKQDRQLAQQQALKLWQDYCNSQ